VSDQKYGPQTAEIESLIAKIATLTDEQVQALEAAWYAAWDDAWNAALDSALDAIWNASLNDALDATWEGDLDSSWNAARYAILALLVRDIITPEQFEVLYDPWKSVMEVKR
jgi:hypothetical protein